MKNDWEAVKRIVWRKLLALEPPVSVVMRRRENGRWTYREPTEQEALEFLSNDAW
jgi:hypothetical protein